MTAVSTKFGWSYPPGCEGPPDETWPEAPRCEKCGAFLRHDPDARTEDVWEDTDLARDRTCVPKDAYNIRQAEDFGYIYSVLRTDLLPVRRCRKCGTLNTATD
jgi:hypothetical protein